MLFQLVHLQANLNPVRQGSFYPQEWKLPFDTNFMRLNTPLQHIFMTLFTRVFDV